MRVRLKIAPPGGVAEWREFEAASSAEGVRLAMRSGLRVIALDSLNVPDSPGSSPASRVTTPLRARQAFPLLLFTQELLALLDAGLNVVEVLQTLQRKENTASTKAVMERLIKDLSEGKSFSDALAQFPEIFPSIYIAGVQASEKTGLLIETLTRFVAYQLQLDVIRKKVVSSAIYPVLLTVVGVLVTLFLLGYVVPKFSMVLEGTRGASSASQMLLALGSLIGQHQAVIGATFFCLLLLGVAAFSQPSLRQKALLSFSNLPFLRVFALTLSLARFYRTVALLLDAGIPLLRALDMSSSLLLPRMAAELAGVREKVRSGLPLSAAMANTVLLTPIAESLIKVGEKSGKLAEMMERTARFCDEELARQVDWFTRLFEPLLMAFIGLVIGMVVVLMFMPIFDLVGSF